MADTVMSPQIADAEIPEFQPVILQTPELLFPQPLHSTNVAVPASIDAEMDADLASGSGTPGLPPSSPTNSIPSLSLPSTPVPSSIAPGQNSIVHVNTQDPTPNQPPDWFSNAIVTMERKAMKEREMLVSQMQESNDRNHNSLQSGISKLTDQLLNLSIKQEQTNKELHSRIDQLAQRLSSVENAKDSNPNQRPDDPNEGSPSKRFKNVYGAHSNSSPPPVFPGSLPPMSSAGPSNVFPAPSPSIPNEQAKKPTCLRLKGFQYKLPKPDMISLTTRLLKHAGVDDKCIKDMFCEPVAGSCVVEFITELDARKALDLSKNPPVEWFDAITQSKHKLYMSYDESKQVRAMGSAFRPVYDAINQIIVPSCPTGTFIRTNRAQGNIQICVSGRFYPLFQIGSDDGGSTFHFIERRGRWGTPMPPPDCITKEMLEAVKQETSTNGILNN